MTSIAESIVPLPVELRVQIAQITPAQLPEFTREWMASMLERSQMIKLADEVDVTRCDTETFVEVLRSARSFTDLDFMVLASALRV